jgi:hypothetical protein
MHINLFFEFNAQINVLNTQGYKRTLAVCGYVLKSR